MYTIIDDHSRVAYTEAHDDKTAVTAVRVLYRAVKWFAELAEGWAYASCYQPEQERRDALKAWLRHYHHHRPHTPCANQPPFTRLISVSGQYS